MSKEKVKQTAGRLEHISFPDLGLNNIEAKIDTGAYTTALHCHDIRLLESEGRRILCFKPLNRDHDKEYCTHEYRTKEIKNSFGEVETRFIIKTSVRIGNRKVKAYISLTDRGNMRYPVLIGRRILKNRFLVDVSGTFLLDKKKS